MRISFTEKPILTLHLKFKDSDIAHFKMKATKVGKMASTLFEKKLIEELKNTALFPQYIEILL